MLLRVKQTNKKLIATYKEVLGTCIELKTEYIHYVSTSKYSPN